MALFTLLATPLTLSAQGTPLGPEFRVNSYTPYSQLSPSVTSDSAGNFVVVWEDTNQDGSASGVFAQRYANSGGALGVEFRVNSYTPNNQRFPKVDSDSAGNFAVAWQSDTQDSSGTGIFAQRYFSNGVPVGGGGFLVNTYTTGNQAVPSIASDSAGNFVVVWDSAQDGSGYGVFAQRYASTGAPLGGEFLVNTYIINNQRFPAVASDSAGNFVVVWRSDTQDGAGYGVFAQRYASTGAPLGGEFRINTYTTSLQLSPSVASDSAGNFVVAWTSDIQDGSLAGVFAQRYSSTGVPLGGEFRVNTYTTSNQVGPSVASDSAGNFVVAWQSNLQDGSQIGVFGQRYANTGAPLGAEFRVNTYTTSSQSAPSVASDAAGSFVVTWQSYLQDGSGLGVFAQRYSMIVPVELQSFQIE